MSTVIAKNIQIGADTTATNNFTIYQPATPNGTLLIGNGNTGITSSLVTLNSSGNLGLGVTPSAWRSATDAIQLTGGSIQGYLTNAISLGQNYYFNSSDQPIYLTTAAASSYVLVGNEHRWSIAPSGTAGAAISFTQAMTLDASGNLGIGTTSPQAKLHLSGGSVSMRLGGNGASDWANFGYDGTAYIYTPSTQPILFYTNNTERARIDSSGQFTTAFTGGSGSVGVRSGTSAAAASNFFFFMATAAGVDRFQVRGDGNVLNTNNSYGAISDAKLKENVTDATPKLEKLNQVRVVNYNLIGQEQKQLGVIAQELEQVFPGMVDESPDRDKDGNDLGTTTKSVKYSVFVPMLIKAMQEQQALITALQADVAALKAAA